MKTLFTFSVLLVCGCNFEVTDLSGFQFDTPSEFTGDVRIDNEEYEDTNGESGKLDHNVLDVAEMADEDSSDKPDIKPDELGMPEIPDIPDIKDTGHDVPDVWPDVPDVHDVQDIDADETAQEIHEVGVEVGEEVEIVEVVDLCKGTNCSDDNNCTEDFCLQDTGECIHDAVAYCCLADQECADDDVCNGAETCKSNKCKQGEALKCDDDNVCTDDACVPSEGCVYVPNEEPCDDNDPCTTDDYCAEDGQCVGKTWCLCFTDADCLDDGDLCNGAYKCQGNFCVIDPATVVDCSDDDLCTDDSCDQNTGECVYDAISGCCNFDEECDDGNVCNGVETCVGNKCQTGETLKCNDDNVCTDDSCDSASGCVYTPNNAPCSDGDNCATGDFCSNGACQPGIQLVCDDGNDCTADGCIPTTGCVPFNLPNNTACDDKNACTNGDTCQAGKCKGGAALTCNDNNVCTNDACAPSEGCIYVPNKEPCDDDNMCTDNDICKDSQCIGQIWCVCLTDTNCLDDGDLCNGAYKCQGNFCVIDPATVVYCADDNVCTTDSCKPDTGECVFANNTAPCDDGDNCATGDFCSNGVCQPGAPVLCDDDNMCTADSCNPATGICANTAVADCCNFDKECDNGDKCDGAEICVDHKCVPGAPLVCDDGNECTAGGCVPAVGCVQFNLPNNTACDDKNACTNGDTCQAGKCKGGSVSVCNDNNYCTTDSCDPATGCVNTPTNEGQKCGDANVCNGVETCINGLCAPGTPLNCDDGKECTADECVTEIGCINTQIPGCCVADKDCDNVLNDKDNCPLIANPDQADMDKDNTGDVCDEVNICNLSASGIPSVFLEHNPVCINGCFVGGQIVCIKCMTIHNTCIADADGTSGSICQGDCNDSWYGQAYECWPVGQPPPQCKLPWTPQ